MKDIRKNGDAISFLYNGTPDVLLKALAYLPLTDVDISEPDLEEVFMHYYSEEGKDFT